MNLDNAFVLWYHKRMKYTSLYSKDELIKRWDDITSPARFAGADDELDWIFISSRKGDNVKLVKKPRASYDPYATVFRGKIEQTNDGGHIRGIFTKGLFDYIITLVIAVIYFGVCAVYLSRAEDKTLPLIFISIGVILVLFALIPFPGSRKKYGALIRRVTGSAPADTKVSEEKPVQAQSEKSKEDEEKYNFRVFGRRK